MAVTNFWVELTEDSYSVANNTSYVTVKVKITTDSYSYNELSPSGYIEWGGVWSGDSNTSFSHSFSRSMTTTLFSKTYIAKHNDDGSGTVSASVTFYTGISAGTITASKSLTLTKIPRQATIISAPNFTDEENPTITYSNPAGSMVSSLKACISLADYLMAAAPYRDIPIDGTSYTFELTDEEREKLRVGTTGSNSSTVEFHISTVLNGTLYSNVLERTFTIVNGEPVINPTVIDTNDKTVALTGNNGIFVRYHSNANAAVNAVPQKSAKLSSHQIMCGGLTIDQESGTFEGVSSATFTFSATDNRALTTTKTLEKTLIEYIHLTCNMTVGNPTAEGDMSIKANGNYFNGDFGGTNNTKNTLTVEYRLSENGGTTWGDWIEINIPDDSIGENTYGVETVVTGLDYQTTYTVQTRAYDALENALSATKTVRSMPVFDWSENDFNFNVDVNMQNSLSVQNTLSSQGDLNIGGNASLDGSLVVGGNISFDGSLTVGGNIIGDFIVERFWWTNPNANSDVYCVEKWASGYCRAAGRIVYPREIEVTQSYESWYYKSVSNWAIPPYFVGISYANIFVNHSTGLLGASINTISSDYTLFSWYLYSASSITVTPTVYVVFEGRWKDWEGGYA